MSVPKSGSLTEDDHAAWREFTDQRRVARQLDDVKCAELDQQDLEDWNRWAESDDPLPAKPDDMPAGSFPGEAKQHDRQSESGLPNPRKRGLTQAQLRLLRKGRLKPETLIDLHGMTVEEADRNIGRFLHAQHGKGVRLALVIAGKGKRSKGAIGILNRRVGELLSGRFASIVSHHEHAHANHGGTGAYYVVLRRRRNARP